MVDGLAKTERWFTFLSSEWIFMHELILRPQHSISTQPQREAQINATKENDPNAGFSGPFTTLLPLLTLSHPDGRPQRRWSWSLFTLFLTTPFAPFNVLHTAYRVYTYDRRWGAVAEVTPLHGKILASNRDDDDDDGVAVLMFEACSSWKKKKTAPCSIHPLATYGCSPVIDYLLMIQTINRCGAVS